MKHLNTFERFLNEKEANESLIEAVKFNGSKNNPQYKLGKFTMSGYSFFPILFKFQGQWQISIEVGRGGGYYIGSLEIPGLPTPNTEILPDMIIDKVGVPGKAKIADKLNTVIKKIQF